MSRNSEIRRHYTATHLERYEIEIWHDELGRYHKIKGTEKQIVEYKAKEKMKYWDDLWQKASNVEKAKLKTEEAEKTIKQLENILSAGIENIVFDWEHLKKFEKFNKPMPKKSTYLGNLAESIILPEPKADNYLPKLCIFEKLVPKIRKRKESECRQRFEADSKKWLEELARRKNKEMGYNQLLKKWEAEKIQYIKERDLFNQAIDLRKEQYNKQTKDAIVEYCSLLLSHSKYPSYFPQKFFLEYIPDNKLLIIEYELPAIVDVPTLKEIRYIKAIEKFTEKNISKAQVNKIFDSMIYHIALRSLHELFDSDRIGAINFIVFNGFVNTVDISTGKAVTLCILSIEASKDEFQKINLRNVEPRACFKNLKGIRSCK